MILLILDLEKSSATSYDVTLHQRELLTNFIQLIIFKFGIVVLF